MLWDWSYGWLCAGNLTKVLCMSNNCSYLPHHPPVPLSPFLLTPLCPAPSCPGTLRCFHTTWIPHYCSKYSNDAGGQRGGAGRGREGRVLQAAKPTKQMHLGRMLWAVVL